MAKVRSTEHQEQDRVEYKPNSPNPVVKMIFGRTDPEAHFHPHLLYSFPMNDHNPQRIVQFQFAVYSKASQCQ